jgi:hypothetical protein
VLSPTTPNAPHYRIIGTIKSRRNAPEETGREVVQLSESNWKGMLSRWRKEAQEGTPS